MYSGPSSLIYHGGGKGGGQGFPAPASLGEDIKAKVSLNDNTTDYLNSKIVTAGRLTKTILNPAGNEQLELEDGDHFTLIYTSPNELVQGDFLFPPESYANPWPGSMGYYTDCGFRIKKISVLINNYISFGNDSFEIRLREYIANGSKGSAFATGEGNLIGTVFYNVPNTGGANLWYFGGYDDIDWPVQSGYSLFSYILFSDVDHLHGITVWLHCYKTPI